MRELLLLLTFISILIIGFGTAYHSKITKVLGTILLILILVFGWVMVGMIVSESKITKETATYQKYENEIKVNIKEKTFIFNSKVDFDNITDTTTFYSKLSRNAFYIIMEDKAFYIIKNKKFYSNGHE
jgi:uncharacterized membrane protein (DUF485 family)